MFQNSASKMANSIVSRYCQVSLLTLSYRLDKGARARHELARLVMGTSFSSYGSTCVLLSSVFRKYSAFSIIHTLIFQILALHSSLRQCSSVIVGPC